MRLLLPLVASISVLQSMPIFCLHGCGKELSVLRRLIGACADCDPHAVVIGRPQKLSSEIDEMSRMGATEHNKEGVKWPSLRRRLRVVELFAGSISGTRGLMQAEVPHRLALACDLSASSKQYIQNLVTPETWCDNVKALASTQKQIDLIKDADVVVAGFECVAWSTEGKRQGLQSFRAKRQCITFIEIMRKAKPKMMILENVKRFPLTWFCSRVEARLPGIYRHYWRIYDARLCGLPQRRIRLYLVFQRVDAVLQSMEARQFAWPCTMSRAMTLSKYKSATEHMMGRNIFAGGVFLGCTMAGTPCLVQSGSN